MYHVRCYGILHGPRLSTSCTGYAEERAGRLLEPCQMGQLRSGGAHNSSRYRSYSSLVNQSTSGLLQRCRSLSRRFSHEVGRQRIMSDRVEAGIGYRGPGHCGPVRSILPDLIAVQFDK